jgi:hypothetical protein
MSREEIWLSIPMNLLTNDVSSFVLIAGYYINSNNALDLRDCIMDVLATKNRLRSDDLQDLTVERFLVNAQTVNSDGFVEGLGYWVYGKTEEEQLPITAWAEQTHPEYDPILLILSYLYVTGIKSGYLFASDLFLSFIMVCLAYLTATEQPGYI